MKAPAFQFYPKQWLGDDKVLLMDWDARAMHMHFMCIAWQQEPPCTLPDEDALLRQWVGNPRNWQRIKAQIFRAWRHEGDRWVQSGLLAEYQKQQAYRDSRKSGSDARWNKNAHALQVECIDDALQSSSSSSTTDKEPPIVPQGGPVAVPNPKPKKPKARLADQIEVEFEEDWPKFWLRVSKLPALKAYRKAREQVSRERLMSEVVLQGPRLMADAERNERTPVYPSSWMNAGRWTDEPQYLLPARASPVPVVPDNRPLSEVFLR